MSRERGSRAVLAQIDARLAELDVELSKASDLLAERRRLIAARATLTGERQASPEPLLRRVAQDQVAAFIEEHPGSRASEIARALGVPLTNISQHLHRGRQTRFERRDDGWHLRTNA